MVTHIFYRILRTAFAAQGAIRRRFARWRTQRALAELNKHQLRDIGLCREEVRAWSERLRSRLEEDSNAEKCRRALGNLNEDQLSNLSEAGLRAWRAARRAGHRG